MYKAGSQDVRRSKRLQKIIQKDLEPSTKPPQATAGHLCSPPSNKRKRSDQVETPRQIQAHRSPKRRRLPPAHRPPKQDINVGPELGGNLSTSQKTYISHWADQQTWPEQYYQQEKARMHHLLARQWSSASLRRQRSDPSLVTSITSTASDQKPREEKSAPYKSMYYPLLLETLGNSYMDDFEQGIAVTSKTICHDLLATNCITPTDTLFRDDVFPIACRNLRDKNEARVIQDIARLLVPSPESLAALGAKRLDVLAESVNEGWNNCVPVTSTRPQPDFAVGFRKSMFSDDQLVKLEPMLGGPWSLSFFRATSYMYFPFLTCEVLCGAEALDIADRPNAHSMTIAVRGILELYKLAKRDKELYGRILTFSVSHDHRTVRLYGHYPIIDGSETKIYRHEIHTFDITALDGKDKWTTYSFVVAVYNHSLSLLNAIRSVIDALSEQVLAEICATDLSDANTRSLKPLVEQQITSDTSRHLEQAASRKKPKSKAVR
ncbi:MAG: hypothetical protein Q9223_001873 [Gallowayella weberi]